MDTHARGTLCLVPPAAVLGSATALLRRRVEPLKCARGRRGLLGPLQWADVPHVLHRGVLPLHWFVRTG